MTDNLKRLIEAARKIERTSADAEEQRRSFAYGNTKFENDRITRQMVDSQAELLAKAGE